MDALPDTNGPRADPIHQLEDDLKRVLDDPARFPRTTKLLAADNSQRAKKIVEEAAELAIEAVRRDKGAAVREAADLMPPARSLWDRGKTTEERQPVRRPLRSPLRIAVTSKTALLVSTPRRAACSTGACGPAVDPGREG
jgi:phosphoribosyl-ATP pyrophosphohydrolase